MADDANILELLDADHRRISAALAGEETELPLPRELSMHLYAEEEVLYPAVRRSVADGDDLTDDLLEIDHQVLEELADVEDEGLAARRDNVADLFRRHVAAYERAAASARVQIEASELERLGGVLLATLAEAPTHPHPHLIDHGPFKPLADAAASAIDHIRDYVHHEDEEDGSP